MLRLNRFAPLVLVAAVALPAVAESPAKKPAPAATTTATTATTTTATTWDIDPAHSTVGFVVKHLVIAKVRGSFKRFSGTVVIDAREPAKSSVVVTIDPASVDTGIADRDAHLRGEDFFNVATFKEMKFVSTKVDKSAAGLKVTGNLTMHGVTKPVVLDVTGPSPEIKDPAGNPHVAFSATTTVKRADFGLTWNKAIEGGSVVGEDVTIELEVELKNKR
ncbi:MAG TPA: YceI family protein [Myxococcota bacterium]